VTVLAQAAFAALWLSVGGHASLTAIYFLLAISALGMGFQTAAVFSLGIRGVFTTAATATALVRCSSQRSPSSPYSRRVERHQGLRREHPTDPLPRRDSSAALATLSDDEAARTVERLRTMNRVEGKARFRGQ
jgi:hypothetical protein